LGTRNIRKRLAALAKFIVHLILNPENAKSNRNLQSQDIQTQIEVKFGEETV
jgi:hypothetical protein